MRTKEQQKLIDRAKSQWIAALKDRDALLVQDEVAFNAFRKWLDDPHGTLDEKIAASKRHKKAVRANPKLFFAFEYADTLRGFLGKLEEQWPEGDDGEGLDQPIPYRLTEKAGAS